MCCICGKDAIALNSTRIGCLERCNRKLVIEKLNIWLYITNMEKLLFQFWLLTLCVTLCICVQNRLYCCANAIGCFWKGRGQWSTCSCPRQTLVGDWCGMSTHWQKRTHRCLSLLESLTCLKIWYLNVRACVSVLEPAIVDRTAVVTLVLMLRLDGLVSGLLEAFCVFRLLG